MENGAEGVVWKYESYRARFEWELRRNEGIYCELGNEIQGIQETKGKEKSKWEPSLSNSTKTFTWDT